MRSSARSTRLCLTAGLIIAVACTIVRPPPAEAEDGQTGPPGTSGFGARHGGDITPYATGFVRPSIHVPTLRRSIPLQRAASLPSRFDWREYGKVTPVRNQSSCGSCYAFAAIASIEGVLLAAGEPEFDFSENNAKECEWYESSCWGGNFLRVANYLSQHGTVLETCDPYVPADVPCNDTCPHVITLLGWTLIAGDSIPEPGLIKSYIYTYGPVYTTLYVGSTDPWGSEVRNYDGSYTLYHETNYESNHAVLLVGWDDDLPHAGGTGAWIAKNSWGTGWGGTCGYGSESGYFTMGYGSANIGSWTSYMSAWQEYDPDGRLFYYDEGGYSEDLTDLDGTTGWGLCGFNVTEETRIERVEFWTTDVTTDVDVYVYDDFDGMTPTNLLASSLDWSFDEIGYHSAELSSPVVVGSGDDVYAVVKFTNVSFEAPIAVDNQGVPETGMCFVSSDGVGWQDVKGMAGHPNSDVCIRLRGTLVGGDHTWRVPGDAATIQGAAYLAAAGDTVLVGPGTYHETSIEIDKTIAVIGEAGPESTIISGSTLALNAADLNLITFEGVTSAAVLKGFTITGIGGVPGASAIYVDNASPSIEDCIITGMMSSAGAAIFVAAGAPCIKNCTINGNTLYSALYYGLMSGGTVQNSIISNTSGGRAVTCMSGANPVLSCCDIYGNGWGDEFCGTDGGGNFSEDPLFCDAPGGDYSLQDASPCLTGYGCGRIGALGQGCPTHVPGPLADFSVTPGDDANALTWTLPAPPVQGAYIVYSTAGYPGSPGEGIPVENGNAGYFAGTPSAEASFTHGGLDNGTVYYYTAFAYNGDLFSESGLSASGTPEDTEAPGPPVDLVAEPDLGCITLFWTYPDDADLEGVIIRYSTLAYPATVEDGSAVENGAGGEFVGEPGDDTSFVHLGLTNDVTYYYSAFAFDEIPYYSTPSQASGSPGDVIPPGPLSAFTIETADSALKLVWTNPADPDFEGTLIKYSETSFPLTPADGSPVENGASGVFDGGAAAPDSFTHGGLLNGQEYYYSAFAFDGRLNYSAGTSRLGTPADEMPPGPVYAFTATPRDTTVVLRWTNPADVDYEHTLIRYSTVYLPASPSEGAAVENGDGGRFFGAAADVDSFVHSGLENDTTYYYAAFAADEVPNHSAGAQASSTPQDVLPPPAVISFAAIAGDGSSKLLWTSPDDADLKGVIVMYSTEDYPAAADLGTAVENANGGRFAASPAEADSFVHAGLINETRYYYSIFAYDEVPNHSAGDTVSVIPFDQTPPVISVSVFQNPYITNHIDVYVIASEAMDDTSMSCSIGATDVALSISDEEQHVWRGDYDLCSTGTLSIGVSGRDLRGNPGSAARDFTSSTVLASTGGAVSSCDGRFAAELPGGRLGRDIYILVFESGVDTDPGGESGATGTVYRMSPQSLRTSDFFEISIEYDEGATNPEFLTLARFEDGAAVPLDSYVKRDEGRIAAFVKEFGSYTLMQSIHNVTPDYGGGTLRVQQNAPNPFVSSTSIVFHLPGVDRVRVEVLTIEGRAVRTLIDGVFPPGRHSVEWDGLNSESRRAGSGLYLYTVRARSGAVTRKMLLLR